MRINGLKIGIRKFRNDDISPFCEAVKESFEHMKDFMPWCHSEYSIEESESWVSSRDASWANEDEFSFVIYSLKNNEILGGVGINEISSAHKIGNIGYWVRKKALNQGVATEAVSLIANFGFHSQ